ncbi:unnamed protein product, partial [marine sediment metagenome]
MKTTVSFLGNLMPDLPDRENPGVIKAVNCRPLAKSYEPFHDHVPDMAALPSACIGARSVQDYALDNFSYCGTISELYQRIDDGWTARGTGDYTGDTWEFRSFNDNVYACNGVDPLQVSTVGGPAFADVADAPPQAKHIGISRNHVIVGNLSGNPRTVQW